MNINTRNLSFVNFNNEEVNWIKFNGVTVYESWRELTKSGVPPLSIKSSGADLIDYKMFGNSIQNGTPTPDAPIEIESVGVKSKNLLNMSGRTLGTLNGGGSASIRTFEFDKYYVGLTANNYYYKDMVVSYSVNGNVISIMPKSSGYGIGYPIRVKPNTTYVISAEKSGIFGVGYYTEDGEYINNVYGSKPYKFTTPENCKIATIICRPTSTSSETIYQKIQVEEGDTPTSYEEYNYKIPVKVSNGTEEIITNIYLNEPLRKIGEYADYIDFENKKIVRVIEKRDCSELIWIQHQTYKNIYSVNSARFKKGTGLNAISEAFDSTKYLPSVSIRDMKVDYCIKTHATNSAIYISDSVHTTLDDFEEFVKDKFIYYILNEQEEQTIELPSIATLKGNVIIEIVDNIQPSNMEIVYIGK
jgi:hypothetical protein